MAVVGQRWAAMFVALVFNLITCAWSFQDFGWTTPKDSWRGGFSNFDPQPPEPFLDVFWLQRKLQKALGFALVSDVFASRHVELAACHAFRCQEVHFHCSIARDQTAETCRAHKKGCPNGTSCFVKSHKTMIYAACCCNQTDTPIDMIYQNFKHWSCFARYMSSPAETHGSTPFCDVHCCKRQGQETDCKLLRRALEPFDFED